MSALTRRAADGIPARKLAIAGTIAAVAVLVFGVPPLLQWLPEQSIARMGVADFGQAAGAFVAAFLAWQARAEHRGQGRLCWAMFAIAFVDAGLAQFAYGIHELVTHDELTLIMWNGGMVLGTLIVMPAVFLYPMPQREGMPRWAMLFDGLTMAASLAFVCVATIFPQVIEREPDGNGYFDVALILLEILLVVLAFILVARAPRAARFSTAFILTGMLWIAASEALAMYENLTPHPYRSGDIPDTAWFIAMVTFSYGAWYARQRPWASVLAIDGVPSNLMLAVPYVPMGIAAGLAGYRAVTVGLTGVELLSISLLIGVVVARQFFVLLDNRTLVRALGAREQELEHRAHHDALTGLANRDLFDDRVSDALSRQSSDPFAVGIAVMFVDLDDFKHVNDTLGHDVGDKLLVEVSARIRGALRPDDLAGRLGGDEFAVLLRRVRGADEAMMVADRIVAELRIACVLGSTVVEPRGTVGVAMARAGELSTAELLSRADAAMYFAKNHGKGVAIMYAAQMHGEIIEQKRRRTMVEAALESHQFELHLQPIVELEPARPVGYEAVVMWRHPGDGLIAIDDYLADIEHSRISSAFAAWVLGEAVDRATMFRDAGMPSRIAVRLSSRQLEDGRVVRRLMNALDFHHCDPRTVMVMLRDGALAVDLATLHRRVDELHETGVLLVLDEFGAGTSALQHLQKLSVDMVAIGPEVIDEVLGGPEGSPIAEGLIKFASTVGVECIARGVISQVQTEELRAAGCRYAGGPHFGTALTAQEWIRRGVGKRLRRDQRTA